MNPVSEVVAHVVADHVSAVFALMGNGNAYFTDALARHGKVRMTGLRHEAGVVASADAYYRVSRKMAVATTTFGPGYTNTITPLAEAVRSRTPMVFVVGDQPTSGPRPWDVDQAAIARSVGAVPLTVGQDNAASVTAEAFAIATEQRLPVTLFIPHDIGAEPAGQQPDVAEILPVPEAPAVDQETLAQAAKLLTGAKRPLILAGRGARDAAASLKELADRLGVLTTSSAPARGTFARRPYDLGVCGGFASEASSELIRQADVVLAVGVGLNQFTTAFNTQFAPEVQLVQIDVMSKPTSPLVDIFIQGTAEDAVTSLLERMTDHPVPNTPWDGTAEHARSSTLNFARETGDGQAPDGLLDPRSAMHRLNDICQRRLNSDPFSTFEY